MKHVVGRWTAIQSKLPVTPTGEDLWYLIELRTLGKLGQAKVAIALTKEQQVMVAEAERQLKPDEQHAG